MGHRSGHVIDQLYPDDFDDDLDPDDEDLDDDDGDEPDEDEGDFQDLRGPLDTVAVVRGLE
jgi:hypothetical protein